MSIKHSPLTSTPQNLVPGAVIHLRAEEVGCRVVDTEFSLQVLCIRDGIATVKAPSARLCELYLTCSKRAGSAEAVNAATMLEDPGNVRHAGSPLSGGFWASVRQCGAAGHQGVSMTAKG